MQKTCRQCSASFEITDADLKFYEDVSPVFNGKKELVPPPTLCPDCRLQRRMAWRNDRTLHHRKSDLTGKQIISMYSADKPLKVYDQNEWLSDQWDPFVYGRDFDFTRTFMDQFDELTREIPHMSLYTTNAENSYYTNHTLNLKNCYLIGGAGNCEDSMYGRFIVSCKDVVDSGSLFLSEWCYEGVASQLCYHCLFFTYSRNCSDCLMIEDCQSCKNCICCFGLINKEYCIMNEEVGKEEFERRLQEQGELTYEKISQLRSNLQQLKMSLPHRHAHIFNCEESTGDMLYNSKNCHACFDCSDCEDSKYLSFTPKGISSHDCTFTAPDGVEWCYEAGSTVGMKNTLFTYLVWFGSNMLYSTECNHCHDCFGCIGLRHKQHCIFNKQYTKEEYEALMPRIIEHMRQTGEWGEHFPEASSRFCYNESVAADYYPLSKEEVLKRGWKWHEGVDTEKQYMGPPFPAPDTISQTDESICSQILTCTQTGKPYKVIPQEWKFYKRLGIPIPRHCPDERHQSRLKRRNPRHLWQRQCANCQKEMQTTYAPDRPEIVYCEQCYLATVY